MIPYHLTLNTLHIPTKVPQHCYINSITGKYPCTLLMISLQIAELPLYYCILSHVCAHPLPCFLAILKTLSCWWGFLKFPPLLTLVTAISYNCLLVNNVINISLLDLIHILV